MALHRCDVPNVVAMSGMAQTRRTASAIGTHRYGTFQQRFSEDYRALDARLEGLTLRETKLGTFLQEPVNPEIPHLTEHAADPPGRMFLPAAYTGYSPARRPWPL
jgi:hypothetical protein